VDYSQNYPEWEIENKITGEDIARGNAPRNIDATLRKGCRAHRYPFEMLERPGMTLTLMGVRERTARTAAYQYAARQGWKLRATVEMENGVPIWLQIRRIV
jgi:hypothetical protein